MSQDFISGGWHHGSTMLQTALSNAQWEEMEKNYLKQLCSDVRFTFF